MCQCHPHSLTAADTSSLHRPVSARRSGSKEGPQKRLSWSSNVSATYVYETQTPPTSLPTHDPQFQPLPSWNARDILQRPFAASPHHTSTAVLCPFRETRSPQSLWLRCCARPRPAQRSICSLTLMSHNLQRSAWPEMQRHLTTHLPVLFTSPRSRAMFTLRDVRSHSCS